MPVLKQNQRTPAMREAIVLDLGDIGAQAARIRAAAEAEASKIVLEAQRKSEAIADELNEEAQKQGYTEGLEQGLAEGREQGRAEALAQATEQLQQLTAAWSQVATDWEQQRTDMEREARQAVLEFALSAAEKIVHRVIEVDETVVIDQAAQALSLVLSAHDASVSIHPVDRPLLEDALPQLLSELDQLEHIDLTEDQDITPGGCVVSFGKGRIDATIERQLQRLIDLILPEAPQPTIDEPQSTTEHAIAEAEASADVDMQGIADAAAHEVDASVLEPVDRPPVYEITDEGLVQTQNQAAGASSDPDGLESDRLLDSPSEDEPDSEA